MGPSSRMMLRIGFFILLLNYCLQNVQAEKHYQLNADGNIDCSTDLDCPPDWKDPNVNCDEEEEDDKKVVICRQTKFEYSCHGFFGFCFQSPCEEVNVTIVATSETRSSKRCAAGALKVSQISAIAVQATLSADNQGPNLPGQSATPSKSSCPQDTCQRGDNCCQLAFYRGFFVCPNFC